MDFERAAHLYQCASVEGDWENDISDSENSEQLKAGEWLLKNVNDGQKRKPHQSGSLI